jgi:quinol-cytochrome oxidoreductase complex cytochrome b subunit
MSAQAANERELRRAHRSLFGRGSRIAGFLGRVAAFRVPRPYGGFRWIAAAALLLFLIQMGTGILLSLYYYPDPGTAYSSTRFIAGEVPIGWLIRSIHHWAAEFLLIALTLQLLTVFFRRAFVRPRQYEWLLGVLLLMTLLFLRFTGRLLPWDTYGYEVTRSGLELLESVPILGSATAEWLKGGEEFGPNTLSRFFTTHVLILPWIVVMFAAFYIYLVLRHDKPESES